MKKIILILVLTFTFSSNSFGMKIGNNLEVIYKEGITTILDANKNVISSFPGEITKKINNNLYKYTRYFKKWNNYGLIDSNGKIVLEAYYNTIFESRNLIVALGVSEAVFINGKGEMISVSSYDNLSEDDIRYHNYKYDYFKYSIEKRYPEDIEAQIRLGVTPTEDDLKLVGGKKSVGYFEAVLKFGYNIPIDTNSDFLKDLIADAIREKKGLTLKYLLKFLLNKNIEVYKQENFLHYALSQKADLGIVKILLDSEIDVNKKDSVGNTPLLYASGDNKNLEIVKELINRGANIEDKNDKGYTPYLVATENNAVGIKNYLKEIGANTKEKDIKGRDENRIVKDKKKEIKKENAIFNKNMNLFLVGKSGDGISIDYSFLKASLDEKMNSFGNVEICSYGVGIKAISASDNRLILYAQAGAGYFGLMSLQGYVEIGIDNKKDFYFGTKAFIGTCGIYYVSGIEKIEGIENSYSGLGFIHSF